MHILQYMMGHSDISLTQQYLNYIDNEVRLEYMNTHPRA